MDTLRAAPALVLDLRGNPGGEKAMMQEMAGLLFERDGTLGRMRFRYETQEMAFRGAGQRAYRGPIAILVDGRSGSCSEVLAGALQALGRAVVVGDTTAGAVLPSQEAPLPTGGVLQYAVSDYRTPTGVLLEGRGVIPDLAARPTSRALLAGRDPALERALAALRARHARR
jgi:carboxyl-terminal processing protease